MSENVNKNKELFLKEVELSFPSLLEPTLPLGKTAEADKRYQATFLIDKKEHKELATMIAKHAEAVAIEKWGSIPEKFEYSCLKDGDDMTGKVKYDGKFFMRTQNRFEPLLADEDGNKVTPIDSSSKKFKSGAITNVVVKLFPWTYAGKHGVSASLIGVQYVKDGDNVYSAGLNEDFFKKEDNSISRDEVKVEGVDLDELLGGL